MPVLEFLRRHPLWVGTTLGALLGTMIGLFLPIRAPAAAPAQDGSWSLPSLAATRSYTEAGAAGARGATFWGDQADTTKRGVQQQAWTLKAIATRPAPRIAIQHGNRNEISWINLRGRLPDGSVLVALDRDTVWVERDGCRSPRHLYASSADPATDPCAAPGTSGAAASPNRTNQQKTESQ